MDDQAISLVRRAVRRETGITGRSLNLPSRRRDAAVEVSTKRVSLAVQALSPPAEFRSVQGAARFVRPEIKHLTHKKKRTPSDREKQLAVRARRLSTEGSRLLELMNEAEASVLSERESCELIAG